MSEWNNLFYSQRQHRHGWRRRRRSHADGACVRSVRISSEADNVTLHQLSQWEQEVWNCKRTVLLNVPLPWHCKHAWSSHLHHLSCVDCWLLCCDEKSDNDNVNVNVDNQCRQCLQCRWYSLGIDTATATDSSLQLSFAPQVICSKE